MIDKNCGFYSLVCDCCGEQLPEEFFEFHDAVEAKKEEGWKSVKVNGKWEDHCPSCHMRR